MGTCEQKRGSMESSGLGSEVVRVVRRGGREREVGWFQRGWIVRARITLLDGCVWSVVGLDWDGEEMASSVGGSRLCMLTKMAVWVVQLDVGIEKTRGAEEGEKEWMEDRKERLTARAGCLL